MRKPFALLAALSAAIFSARESGVSDISNTKVARDARVYSANGIYSPPHSVKVKNKIRARQKRS